MREEYVLVQKIDGAPHQVSKYDSMKMQTCIETLEYFQKLKNSCRNYRLLL